LLKFHRQKIITDRHDTISILMLNATGTAVDVTALLEFHQIHQQRPRKAADAPVASSTAAHFSSASSSPNKSQY